MASEATGSQAAKKGSRKRDLTRKEKVYAEVAQFFDFEEIDTVIPKKKRVDQPDPTKEVFELLKAELVAPDKPGHVVAAEVRMKMCSLFKNWSRKTEMC